VGGKSGRKQISLTIVPGLFAFSPAVFLTFRLHYTFFGGHGLLTVVVLLRGSGCTGCLRRCFAVAQWRLTLPVMRATSFQLRRTFPAGFLPPLRLTTDSRKGAIAYNHLSLPKSVTKG